MNYTLQQLQERITKMIELQGENAPCAAWIYTAEDCMIRDENDEPTYPCDKHPELAERIFNDVGNNDYIYQVIQECVEKTDYNCSTYRSKPIGSQSVYEE